MLQSLSNTHGVSLRQLLPSAEFHGASDIRVGTCASDSRACQSGDLFVCLIGANRDGHDYAQAAVRRGARAILSERCVSVDGLPTCIVEDSRVAYGQLCQALAGNPSRNVKCIGITGTNGKTTTTALLASVLQAAGHSTGMLGTLGYFDGYDSSAATLTTPGAPELAHWLGRMRDNGCSHAVMEVSSHALSQARVAGIEFDVACVTNIRRDHLDYHGSLANYRAAKAKLFQHLAPEGFVVLNADDPVTSGLVGSLQTPVLTVGMHESAEITASLIERCRSEQTFLISAGSDHAAVRTRMIGDHHIYNCLVATAVGLAYGIDLETIVRGLEAVGQVAGRLEHIECGQPFGVFVDYAHTPHALAAVLDSLRPVTAGKLICVFGAGGNRDAQKRPLMASTVESRADVTIVTSDNPRHEDSSRIAKHIYAGFDEPHKVEHIQDRRAAIEKALALAGPDDCVLIAGKGHETTQIVGNQRIALDDRDVARRWLYNLSAVEARSWGGHAWMTIGNS